jgi:hypothetical protein
VVYHDERRRKSGGVSPQISQRKYQPIGESADGAKERIPIPMA